MNEIYRMELHETIKIDNFTEVKRVPGGWLYIIRMMFGSEPVLTTTFIPWHNEFQKNE